MKKTFYIQNNAVVPECVDIHLGNPKTIGPEAEYVGSISKQLLPELVADLNNWLIKQRKHGKIK
jgi:hypothetical protein